MPEAEAWDNALLDGLLGDVRCREIVLFDEAEAGLFVDFADRNDNLTLGRKGVASGDWVCGWFPGGELLEVFCPKYWDWTRLMHGDEGELASELLWDVVRTKENFEGEREIDRLNVLRPACTSA